MNLKDFVNLIDSKESKDSVLYVYHKDMYGADSYGYYDMNSRSDIEKAIKEYGEVGIESFYCGTIKTLSNEDKISLKVIVSDYATPKKEEEDTIPDKTNVIIIQRSNSDDVVIKANNKKITLSEDGKDIIISEKDTYDLEGKMNNEA